MSAVSYLWGLVITCSLLLTQYNGVWSMNFTEKRLYRDKVVEMFFHAYDSYMDHAYPADELMPLTCKGRVRGEEKGRGDIDYTLGRFSLTLIDTLDTLAVLGAIDEFESAVRQVIRDITFDSDLVVSVFETNIRVVGGLLGGHFAAMALKEQGYEQLSWYDGELLRMAEEVGTRLLPAFNTTTGLPYPKINLRRGMSYPNSERTTCTACAGTMILEFAALSRLTGDPQFEVKAHQAMEAIWQNRHHSHNLVGTVINVHNAQWLRVESGVGAGIDSYYEYCLKSYILFGDSEYLRRFGLHYDAIKRYITNGPILVDVSMNAPHKMTKSFMDSLLAFWPGLQVLYGDIDTAIHIHDMLYHVMERHNFLPEAFTHDFRVHWGNHPLRPEFIESTYYLYKATGDPYYLDVGRTVVNNLNKYARVPCGFAAIQDLKSNTQEDRMDSYVLAETFKYLYLLFAEEEDSPLDMDDFVFTTEAHLLPLSLANCNATLNKVVQDTMKLLINSTSVRSSDSEAKVVTPQTKKAISDLPTTVAEDRKQSAQSEEAVVISFHLTCPNDLRPFVLWDQFEKLVYKQCTSSRFNKRPSRTKRKRLAPPRLSINSLDFNSPEHLKTLSELGIVVQSMEGGRVQVSHVMQRAKSPEDAEEGWYLMQDIMKLTQQQQTRDGIAAREMKLVRIVSPSNLEERGMKYKFEVGPAMFGPNLGTSQFQVADKLVQMEPNSPDSEFDNGCSEYTAEQAELIKGRILLVNRGGCIFVTKVKNAQKAAAGGVIVSDNTVYDESSPNPPPFSMSGDAPDISIPAVFMKKVDAIYLRELLKGEEDLYVLLTWMQPIGTDSPDPEQAKQVSSPVDSDSDIRTDSDSQLFDSGQDAT